MQEAINSGLNIRETSFRGKCVSYGVPVRFCKNKKNKTKTQMPKTVRFHCRPGRNDVKICINSLRLSEHKQNPFSKTSELRFLMC